MAKQTQTLIQLKGEGKLTLVSYIIRGRRLSMFIKIPNYTKAAVVPQKVESFAFNTLLGCGDYRGVSYQLGG